MRRSLIRLAAVLTVAAAGALSAGPPAQAQAGSDQVTGRALLGKLTVAGESHADSYERAKFKHWVDRNGDCQNTRAEVLIDESTRVPVLSSSGCTVTGGKWVSWYDDMTWTAPGDVDIDHVVPLAEAWRSGAWDWTATKRMHYANDLGFAWSLDAVTDNVNQSKGDQDPSQWQPAVHRCKYARHWVAVKYRWRLSVNAAEKRTLSGVLSGDCGALTLSVPTRGS